MFVSDASRFEVSIIVNFRNRIQISMASKLWTRIEPGVLLSMQTPLNLNRVDVCVNGWMRRFTGCLKNVLSCSMPQEHSSLMAFNFFS